MVLLFTLVFSFCTYIISTYTYTWMAECFYIRQVTNINWGSWSSSWKYIIILLDNDIDIFVRQNLQINTESIGTQSLFSLTEWFLIKTKQYNIKHINPKHIGNRVLWNTQTHKHTDKIKKPRFSPCPPTGLYYLLVGRSSLASL